MSVIQKAETILAIKGQIKTAIEAKKGGSVTGSFSTYPTEIANLPTGIDPSTATATSGDVRTGKTFFAGDGNIKSGNMPNAVTSFSPATVSVTRGYLANDFVKGTGVPTVPLESSFTTLTANTQYFSDRYSGWLRYKIFYNATMGATARIKVNTAIHGDLVLEIVPNGEMLDGTAYCEGIYPVFAGDTFQLEVTPPIASQIANAYLKVHYFNY